MGTFAPGLGQCYFSLGKDDTLGKLEWAYLGSAENRSQTGFCVREDTAAPMSPARSRKKAGDGFARPGRRNSVFAKHERQAGLATWRQGSGRERESAGPVKEQGPQRGACPWRSYCFSTTEFSPAA